MVKERRAAVGLAERLHLLDGCGHGLQEVLQDRLKRKETTPSLTDEVDEFWSSDSKCLRLDCIMKKKAACLTSSSPWRCQEDIMGTVYTFIKLNLLSSSCCDPPS